jgi:hypothetical protein
LEDDASESNTPELAVASEAGKITMRSDEWKQNLSKNSGVGT